MFFYTYVLKCSKFQEKEVLYIGFTNNLTTRLARHRSGKVTATREYSKIELVYYEACRTKQDAIDREKSLKTGFGRAFIKNRLKSDISCR